MPTHTLARSRDDEAAMRRLLQKSARQGKLHLIVRDLFYLPEAVARLGSSPTPFRRFMQNVARGPNNMS